MRTKNITFFTPTLLHTGSEIVLVNLLSILKDDFKATLVSYYATGNKGIGISFPIDKQYLYFFKNVPSFYQKIFALIERLIVVPYKLRKLKNSIWYINTIVLPEILTYAIKWKIPVIMHVHELEQMYSLLSKAQLEELVSYPDLVIANSNTSADVLTLFGRKKKIEICYPSIQTTLIKHNEENYLAWRKLLGIKTNTMLWVMCGTLDQNKNPELFLAVVKLVVAKNSSIKFMWIGGTSNVAFENQMKFKATELGITDSIIWAGDVGTQYLNYFNAADGFMLTSKRESFSLVTLEALLLGLPIVANNCGGVSEILRNDVGKITNSAQEMAEVILSTKQGEARDTAPLINRAREFDLNADKNQWNKLLTDFIEQR